MCSVYVSYFNGMRDNNKGSIYRRNPQENKPLQLSQEISTKKASVFPKTLPKEQ